MEGEERVDSHTEHITPKGRTLHLRLTWAPLQEEDGSLAGAVVLATDVADHADTTDPLVRSESRYREIMESLGGVLFHVDSYGILHYVSPACHAVYGYQPNELNGQSIRALGGETQGERDLEALAAMMHGGDCTGYHATHTKKNGDAIEVVVFANPLDDDSDAHDMAVGVAFPKQKPPH